MQINIEQPNFEVGNKLKDNLAKYSLLDGQLNPLQTERYCRQVLGIVNQNEIDFIVHSLFKEDFHQNKPLKQDDIINILLKRYCGEITLKRMFEQKLITKGKIKIDEFNKIINKALQFSGLRYDYNQCKILFSQIDKNKDGQISSSEYMQFIGKYICFPQESGDSYWDLSKKVRKNTKLLAQLYDKRKDQLLDRSQVQEILVNQLNYETDNIDNIIKLVFKYDLNRKNKLTFDEFTNFVVQQHFGQIIFQRLNQKDFYQRGNQQLISRDQFTQTLIFCLRILDLQINQDQAKILYQEASNFDSQYITVQSYKTFLKKYFGTVAYKKKIQFQFSSHNLADRARSRIKQLLIQYDYNKDKILDNNQVTDALKKLLQQNETEVNYMIWNPSRYSQTNSKRKIYPYNYLINFCAEQHFGQMALQRLHYIGKYSRGQDRIMNQSQFGQTLTKFLGYLKLQPTNNQICTLFKQIDLQRQGWITYEFYFIFIRQYFGFKYLDGPDDILQDFIKKIKAQIVAYFDRYKTAGAKYLTYQQVHKFCRQIIKQESALDFNLFSIDLNPDYKFSLEQFVDFVLSYVGADLAMTNFLRKNSTNGELDKVNTIKVVKNAFNKFKATPSDILLNSIYNNMKTRNNSETVSTGEYYKWFTIKFIPLVKLA